MICTLSVYSLQQNVCLAIKTKFDFETTLSLYNDGVGRKYIPYWSPSLRDFAQCGIYFLPTSRHYKAVMSSQNNKLPVFSRTANSFSYCMVSLKRSPPVNSSTSEFITSLDNQYFSISLFLFLLFCLKSFALGKHVTETRWPRRPSCLDATKYTFPQTLRTREHSSSRKLPGKLPGKIPGLKITGDSRNTRKIIGDFIPGHLPGLGRDFRETGPSSYPLPPDK